MLKRRNLEFSGAGRGISTRRKRDSRNRRQRPTNGNERRFLHPILDTVGCWVCWGGVLMLFLLYWAESTIDSWNGNLCARCCGEFPKIALLGEFGA